MIDDKNDVGILLIHGFTGSPAEMSWLAEQFAMTGYTVRVPTLRGHDATPEDMLNCRYTDWINDVEAEYARIKAEREEVIVIGLSMGGALTLHLAAQHELFGIVCLATPFRLPGWQKWAARLLYRILPWRTKKLGPDIRDTNALKIMRSYYRYPTKAALQVFDLLRLVRQEMRQIICPLLVIHSMNDNTVPIQNAHKILTHVQSEIKRLVTLENSYHVITLDFDKERVFAEILSFIEQIVPEPTRRPLHHS